MGFGARIAERGGGNEGSNTWRKKKGSSWELKAIFWELIGREKQPCWGK